MGKAFFEKIKNIIRWLPILWQDKDFDSRYIYKILYFKLKNMEEFFNSDNVVCATSPKNAKKIRIAKVLCLRLWKNDYLDNALLRHEERFPNYLDDFFNFKPCAENDLLFNLCDKNSAEEQKDFTRCCLHSEYMQKQDINYLFNYIKKYIESWWD